MLPYRNILVAASCTEADQGLFAYAAMLATFSPRASVHLVHVLPAGGNRVSEVRACLEAAAPVLRAASITRVPPLALPDRLGRLVSCKGVQTLAGLQSWSVFTSP